MQSDRFLLRWDNHSDRVTCLLDELRHDQALLDVTLCCSETQVGVHRLVLCACSPYFRSLLQKTTSQNTMFYMKDTAASDLRALVEFIYKGCVNVSQNQLPSFIKLAESLQIRGLSGDQGSAEHSSNSQSIVDNGESTLDTARPGHQQRVSDKRSRRVSQETGHTPSSPTTSAASPPPARRQRLDGVAADNVGCVVKTEAFPSDSIPCEAVENESSNNDSQASHIPDPVADVPTSMDWLRVAPLAQLAGSAWPLPGSSPTLAGANGEEDPFKMRRVYSCKKCGRPANQDTGHRRYSGHVFCPVHPDCGLDYEAWLARLRSSLAQQRQQLRLVSGAGNNHSMLAQQRLSRILPVSQTETQPQSQPHPRQE